MFFASSLCDTFHCIFSLFNDNLLIDICSQLAPSLLWKLKTTANCWIGFYNFDSLLYKVWCGEINTSYGGCPMYLYTVHCTVYSVQCTCSVYTYCSVSSFCEVSILYHTSMYKVCFVNWPLLKKVLQCTMQCTSLLYLLFIKISSWQRNTATQCIQVSLPLINTF